MQHCKHCKTGYCVKAGIQSNGKQKWRCKLCHKYQQAVYSYQSYLVNNETIKSFVIEGLGIRSVSRLLKISCTTVIRRIRIIATHVVSPSIYQPNQVYEVDEMHTFIRKKGNDCWIIYAIERSTRQVVDFRLGRRTKSKLKQVVESVLYRQPKRIYTDRLKLYQVLIPHKKHRVNQYGTNIIERHNLSLRTHLKRLNRRTICFSKKQDMLST